MHKMENITYECKNCECLVTIDMESCPNCHHKLEIKHYREENDNQTSILEYSNRKVATLSFSYGSIILLLTASYVVLVPMLGDITLIDEIYIAYMILGGIVFSLSLMFLVSSALALVGIKGPAIFFITKFPKQKQV